MLYYGDSNPVAPPTNITIQGNEIINVLGSGDTQNVLIERIHFQI